MDLTYAEGGRGQEGWPSEKEMAMDVRAIRKRTLIHKYTPLPYQALFPELESLPPIPLADPTIYGELLPLNST